MRRRDIQHPEIDWIERTGYPSYAQPKKIYCGECGKCLDDEDIYEDRLYEYLCEDCLLFFHKKWRW